MEKRGEEGREDVQWTAPYFRGRRRRTPKGGAGGREGEAGRWSWVPAPVAPSRPKGGAGGKETAERSRWYSFDQLGVAFEVY